MSNSYATSLYVADIKTDLFPPLRRLRHEIWNYLKENLSSGSNIELSDSDKSIKYNNVKVIFKVRHIPEERKILLAFFPYDDNVAYWKKKDNENAAKNTLDFCKEIGDSIVILIDKSKVTFTRHFISTENIIRIHNWEISLNSSEVLEKYNLNQFLENIKNTRYSFLLDNLPRDNNFLVFTKSFLAEASNKESPVYKLIKMLQEFGSVAGTSNLTTAAEFITKYDKVKETAFIFLDKKENIEEWYQKLKIFFDINEITSQYVSDTTVNYKLVRFAGVKTNFFLEILTKLGKKPIFLKVPEDTMVSEGFLCLSDIRTTPDKFFGALFTYSQYGFEKNEEVQIYKDIDFSIDKETDSIDFDEKNLSLLSEKINLLIGRNINIDIILTREWKYETLTKFVNILQKKGISVKKVYYISSKTSRFVDEYIVNKFRDKLEHPFLIIGNRIGFLRTSTGIRIYANLPHLFIKLMWPDNSRLEIIDLKKILWLTKKRTYRIQEFDVLKIPEPIHIFRNIKKMYLTRISTKLAIPLRLLI